MTSIVFFLSFSFCLGLWVLWLVEIEPALPLLLALINLRILTFRLRPFEPYLREFQPHLRKVKPFRENAHRYFYEV